MPIRLAYWEYDDELILTCPSCGWTGQSGRHQEIQADVLDVRCPTCDRLLLVVVFPTLADTRAAAAAGNQEAIADLAELERSARDHDEAMATLLTDASMLPELEGDRLVIDWDLEGGDDAGHQVLRHEGRVLWRESAFWESYRRFEEVFALLVERYGDRFVELRPTPSSESWLYGDQAGASDIVAGLNESRRKPPSVTDSADLLVEIAQALDATVDRLREVLPAPIRVADVDFPRAVGWLVCGDPQLVLVGLGRSDVIVGQLEVVWWGQTPVTRLRQEAGEIPHGEPGGFDKLASIVEQVSRKRRRAFTRCNDCARVLPPEWMLERDLCQGCAERNHGVVF